MFIPNTTATVYPKTGLNIYGEPSFGSSYLVECGIVRINTASINTTVRADSSASRGSSDEEVSVAKILFKKPINRGDKVVIQGMTLLAIKTEPRLAVTGVLDHYEVDFAAWSDV